MVSSLKSPTWDLAHILSDPFLLTTISTAAIGWLIAFVSSVTSNVVNGNFPHFAWWTVLYELFIISGVIVIVATHSVDGYRLAMLAYLSAGFAFATSITNVLIYSSLAADEAAAAGHIFISIVFVVWIFYFGSTPQASPHAWIDSYSLNRNAHPEMNRIGPTPRPATGEGSMRYNSYRSPTHTTVYSSQKTYRVPTPLTGEPGEVVPPTEYPHRARAIYAYEANPEDPNEISFAKGEVLDVSDVAGKWWQVRKNDGAMGIAPSNYLALVQ